MSWFGAKKELSAGASSEAHRLAIFYASVDQTAKQLLVVHCDGVVESSTAFLWG